MRRPLHVVVELENADCRPPLPLFHFFVFSIFQYFIFHSLLLLLILLFVIVIIFTELLALYDRCMSRLGRWAGLMAGLQVGRLLGCYCYLGLGSAAPAPGFLSIQLPCETRTLNLI